MLQNLREHAQGWIAGVIAVILCLAFALWGIQYYIGGNGDNSVVAKVNGEEVTVNQWNTIYKRLRNSLGLPAAQMDSATLKQLKQQALLQVVRQTVLAQAAYKENYRISNAEISAIITQVPAFQVQGQFSPELYQRLVGQLFGNETAFIKSVREDALIMQARSGIIDSDFTTANELNTAAVLANQQRSFGYFIIPFAPLQAGRKISDAMIKDYFNSHQNDFMTEEQISLDYILLSADTVAKDVNVSESELQQYYNDNQLAFSSPQEWQLARIVINSANKSSQALAEQVKKVDQQLRSGQDFARVAMQNSEDKTTAFSGGTMPGWVSQRQLPAELVKPLLQLRQGQVSMPIPSKEGVYFIKVLAIKTPEPKPFAEVRADVEKNIKQQKLQQLLADKSDQLANLTFTNPDTLKVAADSLGIPVQSTGLFSRANPLGIAKNPRVINAAYGDNVLKQRNNSDVISLDNNTLAVVRIGQYKASHLKPLAEIQPQIEQKLLVSAAQAQAAEEGRKVLQALKQGTTVQQIAGQSKYTWTAKNKLTRQSTDLPAEILTNAFSLTPPVSSIKPTVAGIKLENGDYVVMALTEVINPNPASLNLAKQPALSASLADQQGQFYYYLYMTQKMADAKIKYTKSPVEPTGE